MADYQMNRRVAIIDGVRTPFVKAFTHFRNWNAIDLGKKVVKELIERSELDVYEIDEVIMGCVVPPTFTPNIAREIILTLGLPRRIPGFTVNRACASSIQSIANAAESIACGNNEVVIAGGAESMSAVPVPYPHGVIQKLWDFNRERSLLKRLRIIRRINPFRDFIPRPPRIAEFATGYTMGQHADQMARKNGITREEQDRYALLSHQRAARATEEGIFTREIIPVYPSPDFNVIKRDTNVRADTSLKAMAALKPAFDKKYGTVTAANASPLTDGGSAVLLMSEEKARSLGYRPKAYIRSYACISLDPFDQLLLGPSYSTPIALGRAGVKMSDIDLFEMHEAFAAQVLSNIKAMGSVEFARIKLRRDEAVGEIDIDRLNVNGGSIAIGHPFGATGARLVATLTNELIRRDKNLGLIMVCAAGAMGASMVIERA